jgi:bifunctional DNA-binding transcriptional regulator/antitoxin component of YhaV-PrlF toxin-antitoxin module
MAERKRMTRTIRAIRSGQITIPADFRRELDITDDTLLQMSLEGEELRIRKLRAAPDAAGSPWLAELYQRFAPVRQEAIDRGYSEEEINEAIDQALASVRAAKHG